MDRFDAVKVKLENTALLKSKGIHVIEHLPYLDEPHFRPPEDVAKRCMVVTALLMLSFEAPSEHVATWLEENGLTADLTATERRLLSVPFKELPPEEQSGIAWSIEALWAFAWIAGLHDSLTLNTPVEDTLASMLPSVEKMERADAFLSQYTYRDKVQIFKTLDYFYRAHWYARQYANQAAEVSPVDLDLIMERRKALEWVCDSDLEWDKVPLDT